MTDARLPALVYRRRLLVALLAGPAVLTALGLIALEAWRGHRPTSPLFVTPRVVSLADAIERHDVERAYEFIRAGQSPNDLIEVHHATLTGGRQVLVSPLVWAAAMNSTDVVLMLLGFGAHMDRPADRRAACLADQLGNTEVAGLLRRYGDAPPVPCPVRPADSAPLLAFLAES